MENRMLAGDFVEYTQQKIYIAKIASIWQNRISEFVHVMFNPHKLG